MPRSLKSLAHKNCFFKRFAIKDKSPETDEYRINEINVDPWALAPHGVRLANATGKP